MQNKARHLVFYDGECGLCDFCVRFIWKKDRNDRFAFAPLQGESAKRLLQNFSEKNVDSLILIENFQSKRPKVLTLGKAALRIAWHLGGIWSLLGIISFLPSFLYNWLYKLVARNRKSFLAKEACTLPQERDKKKFLS
jgi:predicted DCC family thiol-disulfide oxidoreductase YuxK